MSRRWPSIAPSELFGADHANVQPHSGANANMCAYQALLEFGDTVLGLSLDHGGHLTHGSPVNASGKLYKFVPYKVTPGDERIDMDQVRDLALEHRPKMIVAGTTSYPRRLDPEPFKAIADEIGAYFLFDAAHLAGLIAGGAHPNPVPYADIVTFTTHKTLRGPRGGCILSTAEHAAAIDKAVFPGWQGGPLEHVIAGKAVAFYEALQPSFTEYAQQIVLNASALAEALAKEGFRLVSGGTDSHLMVVDLRPFDADLTGKETQAVLDQAGITLNKNTIPDDPRSPFVTSGVRIGTPSVTTQGMKEPEMAIIASLIARVLRERTDRLGHRHGPGRGRCALREVPRLQLIARVVSAHAVDDVLPPDRPDRRRRHVRVHAGRRLDRSAHGVGGRARRAARPQGGDSRCRRHRHVHRSPRRARSRSAQRPLRHDLRSQRRARGVCCSPRR